MIYLYILRKKLKFDLNFKLKLFIFSFRKKYCDLKSKFIKNSFSMYSTIGFNVTKTFNSLISLDEFKFYFC